MTLPVSLLSELESAVQSGSPERRLDTLRHVTDLFLSDSSRLNAEQINLFDDVLGCLIESIEAKALAQLSARLAPVGNAPRKVIHKLARDDEISVAGPILTHSTRLDSADLVEIARSKGEAHLLAISGRTTLDTTVTDVLVDRGSSKVVDRLVDNAGAAFSRSSFATLVRRAGSDQTFLERLGRRTDLPIPVFRDLVNKATDTVKARLLASAPQERRAEVRRVLTEVSCEVGRGVGRSREDAERQVQFLHEKGELDLLTLVQFARADKFEEVRAGVALLLSAPFSLLDRLMMSQRRDAWLVLFKAIGMDIAAVFTIMQMSSFPHGWSVDDVDHTRSEYAKLSATTARRVLRFWMVRQATSDQRAAEGAPIPTAQAGA